MSKYMTITRKLGREDFTSQEGSIRWITWLEHENNSVQEGTSPHQEVAGRTQLAVSLIRKLTVYQYIYNV